MDNEIAINNDVTMNIKPEIVKITGMGVRLKKAREAMLLTEKEAAARLYLNPRIITTIESEAFLDGPPITFMRGYLRSYARMLNLPETDIKAGLDELETIYPQTTPNKPVLHATPINRSDRYIRWITYLVMITLIVLVVLWWSSHSKYVITDVPANDFNQETEAAPAAEPVAAATPVTAPPAPVAAAPIIAVRDTTVTQINADTPPKKVKAAKRKSATTNHSAVKQTKKPEQSVISNMELALPES